MEFNPRFMITWLEMLCLFSSFGWNWQAGGTEWAINDSNLLYLWSQLDGWIEINKFPHFLLWMLLKIFHNWWFIFCTMHLHSLLFSIQPPSLIYDNLYSFLLIIEIYIARETTDPGYWVYNLNQISDSSYRLNTLGPLCLCNVYK